MEKVGATTVQSEYMPSFLNNQSEFDDIEDLDNGLCLNNVYIPEEVILHIFTYVEPKELLSASLVCRKWNNMIKSYVLWSKIYKQKYNRKPKLLPWYLYYCLLSTNYFDTNLLLNGNGQDQFKHWMIVANGGNKFVIEDPPVGADLLPLDVPEFNNQTSCFATSYGLCSKQQEIVFGRSKLFRYILDNYKPHIYLSEWTAGRFDCGCVYKLQGRFIIKGSSENQFTKPYGINHVEQWQGAQWKKIEITVMEYPEGVEGITFQHLGKDTQFWAGHYGSKMAGGVVKLIFDTIEPLPTDDLGNEIIKKFKQVCFITNGDRDEENHYSLDPNGYYDEGEDEEYYSSPEDYSEHEEDFILNEPRNQ